MEISQKIVKKHKFFRLFPLHYVFEILPSFDELNLKKLATDFVLNVPKRKNFLAVPE